ncbi:MAG: mechanosensitive ion channel family protein [Balneolaceae bacterium]
MDELITDFIPVVWHRPLLIVFILIITVIISMIFTKLMSATIKARAQDSADVTSLVFVRRSLNVIIYLTGISFAIFMIPPLKVIAGSLLAGAGVLALAIGFASQAALANVISGIFIVIFKPYKISDRIQVRTDLSGVVEDINLRHTVIRNFENKRIIIPNSVISNEVVINSNYEDDKICKWIDMGISYDSDIDKAKEIMKEEILKHPNFIDNRSEMQKEAGDDIVPVRVISMGDSSVNLRAWSWAIDPPSAFLMGCDVLESIKKRFDKEGVEIPFPHRTLVYKNSKSEDVSESE